MKAVANEMKTHVDQSCATMGAKFDAAMGEIQKKKSDAGDPDDTLAEQTAADRRADAVENMLRSEIKTLRNQVNDLTVREGMSLARQSASTQDAYADAQAKADAVYRALGESAPGPMSGEDLVAYQIRLTRPLQRHSKAWKNADLYAIAKDGSTFSGVCDAVRMDAMAYSMSPGDAPLFQHREVKKTSPGGHQITEFIGNGTVYKQMSPPVRSVQRFVTKSVHYGSDDYARPM
jgi:hypothetical protein